MPKRRPTGGSDDFLNWAFQVSNHVSKDRFDLFCVINWGTWSAQNDLVVNSEEVTKKPPEIRPFARDYLRVFDSLPSPWKAITLDVPREYGILPQTDYPSSKISRGNILHIGMLIHEAVKISKFFDNFICSHIQRQGNAVTHELSSLALSLEANHV
ncbi:hypothetical protein U1Q18_006887 [Sarracenia purpurea var. burkii]